MPPFSIAVPPPSCKFVSPHLGVQPQQWGPLQAADYDTLHEIQLSFGCHRQCFKARFDMPDPGPYTTLLVGIYISQYPRRIGSSVWCVLPMPHEVHLTPLASDREPATFASLYQGTWYCFTQGGACAACTDVNGTRAQPTHELCTSGPRQ